MKAHKLVVAGVLTLVMVTTGVSAQVPREQRRLGPRGAGGPAGTGSISGVVISQDVSPRPVRRVSVILASGAVTMPRTAVTDDQGRFEFTGLAAGHYTLIGQKPAWVSAVYGARSRTDTQGIPIAVLDGQHVAGLRLPMMQGAVVAGVVRLPGGQPAEGILVQVLQVRVVDGRREVSAAAAPVQTDDLGAYRVFGLAPGDYVVQVRSLPNIGRGTRLRQVTDAEVRWADQQLLRTAAGSIVAEPPPEAPPVAYSTVYFPGTTFASDAAVVALVPAEERLNVDVSLSLVPTATINGVVLGTDGLPAGNAVVVLEPEGSDNDLVTRVLGSGRSVTGQDGTFALTSVAPGRYSLTVRSTPRRPGAGSPSGADARLADAASLSGVLLGILGGGANPATLWATESLAVSGQDIGPLALQLREGLTVAGAVVVEGGGIPPDVSALRIGLTPPSSASPAAMARAVNPATSAPMADGTFAVRGLMPGKYQMAISGKPMRVMVVMPGGAPSPSGWVVKSIRWRDQDLADTGVDVRADVPLTGVVVTLTDRPTELGGTVTDAAGRPVGAFPIVMFSRDRAFWGPWSRRVVRAQPASDGRFSVIGLPAGDYYLAAVTGLEPGELENPHFLEDLMPAALPITIRDGEKTSQDLRLRSGG